MKIHSHNQVSATNPVRATQPQAKKSESRDLASGASVHPADAQKAGAPAGDGHARLDAFSKKIEKRFEGALAKADLTPRQRQALEQERDRFQSMIARFEAAYLDGAEAGKLDAAQGMQKLLQSFSKSVTHILSGGEPTSTPDDPTSVNSTATNPGAGRGRGGIDLVG